MSASAPPALVNARDYPFIGFVRAFFSSAKPDVYAVGTGTLIGPRVVLTAGHVVFDRQYGGYPWRIDVTLGGAQRFTTQGVQVRTTTQWVETDSYSNSPISAFDYGVIALANPVDNLVRPLTSIETTPSEVLRTLSVNVAGYPITPASTLGSLYGAITPLSSFNDFRLFYPVLTRSGMSGGPVFDVDSATSFATIRGVHTSIVNGQGSGVRVTANVHAMIQQWLMEFRPQ
jgi:V8-like Glu-specific endopeptidase